MVMTTKEHILTRVSDENIRFVALWFTDITGVVKSIMIPAQELENVIDNGSHFDGSAIEGFARVAESDMMLFPDLETFTILPWTVGDELTAMLVCTVHTQHGRPFIGDPRYALMRVLEQAEAMGYRFKTGMELEFFLLPIGADNQPILDSMYDDAGYFDIPTVPLRSVRRKMLDTLLQMGIPVDSTHSENGVGQHEIDFQYDGALVSADHILAARVALQDSGIKQSSLLYFYATPVRSSAWFRDAHSSKFA